MDEDKIKELMIDHIDGKLDEGQSNFIENYIKGNPASQKEYTQLKEVLKAISHEHDEDVPDGGYADFLHMIEDQKSHLKQLNSGKGKLTPLFSSKIWMRIAAAVSLVFVGYYGGSLLNNNSEMEELRFEMQQTKELVMISMMKARSTSERMKGVLASYDIKEIDDEILDALIQTMNTDENINVRVAAVEALGVFSDNERAKDALIKALTSQEYPAVQLKLIALMVELGEKRAVKSLQDIINKEEVIQVVKDEAHYGIFKLM